VGDDDTFPVRIGVTIAHFAYPASEPRVRRQSPKDPQGPQIANVMPLLAWMLT
jgi:hypothetical protein